jgi:hypothetical protein
MSYKIKKLTAEQRKESARKAASPMGEGEKSLNSAFAPAFGCLGFCSFRVFSANACSYRLQAAR